MNTERPARFVLSMAACRLQMSDAIRVDRGCMAPEDAMRDSRSPWARGPADGSVRFAVPVGVRSNRDTQGRHARFAASEICPVVASCLNGILLPN